MPTDRAAYNCMAVGDIDLRGLTAYFTGFSQNLRVGVRNACNRCGLLAQREAIKNAPRSPTNKQLSATLKRSRRTIRRTFPGGLEKSIMYEVTADGQNAVVFVPLNSYAGKYARYIHDQKGKKWFKRGAGTIAKGARADDKFVERAIKDNQDNFGKIFNDEIRKATQK